MVRGISILAVIMIHCPSGQNYIDLNYTVWIVVLEKSENGEKGSILDGYYLMYVNS